MRRRMARRGFKGGCPSRTSNEQFEMDDSFQLSITQVHHALRGSGKDPRHLTPGNQFPKLFKRKKKAIILIQNDDDLCCARVLVTVKAKMDNDPQWNAIRLGKKSKEN